MDNLQQKKTSGFTPASQEAIVHTDLPKLCSEEKKSILCV